VTAMRCSAALSCRLPERAIRTRPAALPDHTGIGATPAWRGNAASFVNRVVAAASGLVAELARDELADITRLTE
jgi:hypothetical protein